MLMRFVLAIALSLAAFGQVRIPGIGGSPSGTSFGFSRSLTISHTLVPSTQTNFPVLVSLSDTTLKDVGHSGHVQNSSGYDIEFFSNVGLTTPLFWEIDKYDAVNGVLIAWVKVPSVSSSVDTIFYIAYGNATISTFQSTASSVWDSGYENVYHLRDGSTLSGAESTTHSRTGTLTVVAATAGQIDGAADFPPTTSAFIENAASTVSSGASDITVSFWNYVTSTLDQPHIGFSYGTGNRTVLFAPFTNGTVFWDYGDASNGRISTSYSGFFDAWTYVTVVGKGDNSFQAIYLNGVLKVSQVIGAAPTDISDLLIGRFPTDGFWSWGHIDEFRVSHVVRDANWITTEYNNQSAPGNIGAAAFLTISSE